MLSSDVRFKSTGIYVGLYAVGTSGPCCPIWGMGILPAVIGETADQGRGVVLRGVGMRVVRRMVMALGALTALAAAGGANWKIP